MLPKWEDTYGIPVVSTGVTQIKAMRALGARKIAMLSSHAVYVHVKQTLLAQSDVDVIYLVRGGWRTLDIIETLESDMGVPVLHTVPARVWSTQKSFHVGQRTTGYGRLLAELPDDPC